MLCQLPPQPMVFDQNIGMRNPGFLLEDARHGYIQYISLSECYFAGKGAALVLPPNERARPSRRVSTAGCDIQQHLQSMFYLLRPEETLKMAVKLESVHPGRTRYLVVVSCTGRQDAEESCLLGIDCHARATVGLVLRVLADTAITLDGDGGFSVSVCGRQHIFKPVSVQAMWSALQTLHKVSSKAREQNYFLGGLSHDWVTYYEQRIESDRSCLNEWHAMDNLESRRPPSPDSVRNKPREREETERVIRSTLKEIMMSVDLDEVTSKYIRGRLEEDLDMDLGEFKPFIDQEMLTILGQMDAPTEIFDHVYLGSEWNASNLEELQKNGVRHILNVTREIDNFFPGMFTYLNVRVYDDEKTDLLKHWDDTFKYITKAKKEGSKVLVHCKMGVSRSASVVIAYAMKAYNWDFSQAWKHVKDKRNCIKPNNNFILQLETYQGILDAMKNKEKLQRSKSDTNLKSPTSTKDQAKKEEKNDSRSNGDSQEILSGSDMKKINQRPKSWSPNVVVAENMLPTAAPLSQSLESIDKAGTAEVTREELLRGSTTTSSTTTTNTTATTVTATTTTATTTTAITTTTNPNQKTSSSGMEQEGRNVLMPCDNGQSYSVSQNKIVHLPGPSDTTPPSVKHRVSKLETQGQRRKGLVLNLTNQFEAASSKPSSPGSDSSDVMKPLPSSPIVENGHAQRVWDPCAAAVGCENEHNNESLVESKNLINGQQEIDTRVCSSSSSNNNNSDSNAKYGGNKKEGGGDPFSAQLDQVFDREETKQIREPSTTTTTPAGMITTATTTMRDSPSRQSSWSSYDSAVVLENNSVHSSWATLPSRNSSWGSYDMRSSDLLGSSGLFPYDKEEIPWHPGTVKRTKQKLEEGSTVVKRVCTESSTEGDRLDTAEEPNEDAVLLQQASVVVEVDNKRTSTQTSSSEIDEVETTTRTRTTPPVIDNSPPTPRRRRGDSPSPEDGIFITTTPVNARHIGRLSTSAPAPSSLSSDSDLPSSLRSCRSESETSSPCVVNTPQCPSVKHHKMVLENLNSTNKPLMIFNKRCLSVDDSPETESPRTTISGIVRNLKKEFEAKSSTTGTTTTTTTTATNNNNNNNKSGGSPDVKQRSFENFDQERLKRGGGGGGNDSGAAAGVVKIRSLPSSPVIPHNDSKIQQRTPYETKEEESSSSSTAVSGIGIAPEDLSVRVLVGKYQEIAKPERKSSSSSSSSDVQFRDSSSSSSSDVLHPPAKSRIAPEFARRSAPIMINNGHQSSSFFGDTNTATTEAPGRPPVVPSPSVVVASVVAKAASKKQQQHGRTHPLSRLQVRPRHSSPVYNTM